MKTIRHIFSLVLFTMISVVSLSQSLPVHSKANYNAGVSAATMAPLPCNSPTGLFVSGITNNGTVLNWNAVAGASASFNVQYKLSTEAGWTTLTNVAATKITITTLLPTSVYQWQVQENCPDSSGGYITGAKFKTLISTNCGDPYELNNSFKAAVDINAGTYFNALINSPTDIDYFKLNIDAVEQTNIKITLSNLPGKYHIELYNNRHDLKASTESLPGTMDNVIIYNSNTAKTNYYIVVKGDKGAFNASNCYSLLVETSSAAYTSTARTVTAAEPLPEPYLYPNSAGDYVNLELNNKESKTTRLVIVDAQGREFMRRSVSLIKGRQTITIPVNTLVAGTYFLEGASEHLIKFIKQ